MRQFRILIANEPRSYREVIAAALRALRPQMEVIAVEPVMLDGEVINHNPHLVVCSEFSAVVQRHALAWVMLYPGGAGWATICIAQECVTVEHIELDRLIEVIDQTEHLAQLS